MSKILSQEETAALLEGIADGSVATGNGVPRPRGEVARYDFAAGDHIVRGSLPALRKINERFARDFATIVGDLLHRPATVLSKEIRTLRFDEFQQTVPNPASIHLVSAQPLAGTALMVLDPSLLYMAVDSYFGGPGRAPTGPRAADLTYGERRVATKITDAALDELGTAWQPLLEIDFEIEDSETDAQFAGITGAAETVVVSAFEIALDEQSRGWMQFVMPSSMLGPVRPVLDALAQGDRQKSGSDWQDAFAGRLQEVPLQLRCVLARTRVNLRTVLGLCAGDVIPVNLSESAEITASGTRVFRGRFGVSGGYNAIEMTSRCNGSNNAIAHKEDGR